MKICIWNGCTTLNASFYILRRSSPLFIHLIPVRKLSWSVWKRKIRSIRPSFGKKRPCPGNGPRLFDGVFGRRVVIFQKKIITKTISPGIDHDVVIGEKRVSSCCRAVEKNRLDPRGEVNVGKHRTHLGVYTLPARERRHIGARRVRW